MPRSSPSSANSGTKPSIGAKPATATAFWLQRNPTRRIEWSLIQTAAALGCQIQHQGRSLSGQQTLREALETYTTVAYCCDRDHRRLEQERLKLLNATLPHFTDLQSAYEQLRHNYRQWADQLTQDFNDICQAEGFLPETELQQRHLYDQVVHPLTQDKRGSVLDLWKLIKLIT